ncbi:hypothetical protein BOTNAR_0602g00060 [Botryotinia narcissicola]|uniref:Fe2OG dioxygenase domain-containing protein n=1 Tax=Botryotinia narcissicola TaxID=278944 RepID=A0A4Z1HAP6_9HELO|nr:hypothetical protein BOTNAR_0602g00060 [Botryotinia narcissicola]
MTSHQISASFQPTNEVYEIPLRPVKFPFILPAHAPHFSDQGWSTLSFSHTDPIHISSQKLLQASKSFFDLPLEYKSQFLTGKGTEEGWNQKELLTRYSELCLKLHHEKTSTMIRLFRYESDGTEGKVVSEPHRDLGLLSLSISDAPGLEVLDMQSKKSLPIEQSFEGRDAGTLLVGRELNFLSNNRYQAGGHSVRMYPKIVTRNETHGKENEEQQEMPARKHYRYSIVFVLLGHEDVPIDTNELRTPITGRWNKPVKGLKMENLYRRFMSKYVNINVEMEERQKQRKRLHGKKANIMIGQ